MGTIYFTYFTLHVLQRVHLMNALFPNMMIPTALILTLQRLSGFNVMRILATFKGFSRQGWNWDYSQSKTAIEIPTLFHTRYIFILSTFFHCYVSSPGGWCQIFHPSVTFFAVSSPYLTSFSFSSEFLSVEVGWGWDDSLIPNLPNSCKRMMNLTLWFLLLPPLNPSLNLMSPS